MAQKKLNLCGVVIPPNSYGVVWRHRGAAHYAIASEAPVVGGGTVSFSAVILDCKDESAKTEQERPCRTNGPLMFFREMPRGEHDTPKAMVKWTDPHNDYQDTEALGWVTPIDSRLSFGAEMQGHFVEIAIVNCEYQVDPLPDQPADGT